MSSLKSRRRQVLVGPGTPTGFRQIVAAREAVLQYEWELAKVSRRKRKRSEQKGAVDNGSGAEDPMTVALEAQQQMGAYVVMPCPHDRPCPLTVMKEYSTRWCYFTQRSERTRLQQLTKARSRTGPTSAPFLSSDRETQRSGSGRVGGAQKTRNGAKARNYQDERFSYVILRRSNRGREAARLEALAHRSLKHLAAEALGGAQAGRQKATRESGESAGEGEIDGAEALAEFDPNAVVYSRRLDPYRRSHDDDPKLRAALAVAASQSLGWSRIVNKPGKKVGHVNFVLCTPQGTPLHTTTQPFVMVSASQSHE